MNAGSKVVIAAVGDKKRELIRSIPESLDLPDSVKAFHLAFPGVVAMQLEKFESYEREQKQLANLSAQLAKQAEKLKGCQLILICDDSQFVAKSFSNLIWVAFTRSNPSHDIYGVDEFTNFKHWGCKGPLLIDCRIKPHHAPVLELDPAVEKSVDVLGAKGGSLHGII